MLTPPEGNILKENPRKFMLGGAFLIAVPLIFHDAPAASTDGPASMIMGLIIFLIGFACWTRTRPPPL